MKKIILGLMGLLLATNAHAFDTKATHAYLIDYDTRAVLLDKNGDELMQPASMSKLMTVYMLFDKLKSGALTEEDTFTVSENAWRKGGEKSGSSTMFLKPNSNVKIKDLMKGIIIQSGNDACITVAENLYGSEENFAGEMTHKAREIGLEKSTFTNATGWPDENHLMTPKELTQLSCMIIEQFPEYYVLYSEKDFRYNNIKQGNRNPLLYSMPGQADGIKTGHTTKSGYGMVGSAKSRDGKRRLVLVINGLKSDKERGQEARRIMEWGLLNFNNYTVYQVGDVVDSIPVWMGKKETVSITTQKPIVVTAKRNTKAKIVIDYDAPVKAPVKQGDKLATLTVTFDDDTVQAYPLVAAEDVNRIGYFGKLVFAIKYIFYPKGN